MRQHPTNKKVGFQREEQDLLEEDDFNKDEEEGQPREDNEDPNPYNMNLYVEAEAHVSHKDHKAMLAHMPKAMAWAMGTTKPRTLRVKSLIVDKDIIVGRFVHL